MAKCEVKFDNNPNGIYYSGQTLSGIVELTNEKVRKIRGLSLRIEGFAKVSPELQTVMKNVQFVIFINSVNGQRVKEAGKIGERSLTADEKTTLILSLI